MTQAQQVLDYLWAVAPDGATNAQLAEELGIASQQTVYMLTRGLTNGGRVRSERRGRTSVFYAQESPLFGLEPTAVPSGNDVRAASHFTAFARNVLSAYYGADLAPRIVPCVRKLFALVSPDYEAVGEAKYIASVGGIGSSPAKFAIISEYVWLLEKSRAAHTFLVFGNDRQVPSLWLKRYSNLASEVAFFYLTGDGGLERLEAR
jgi:hypothetical protein